LLLLLVNREGGAFPAPSAEASFVTDILRAMQGDMGTLGWFEAGRTIGLIVPEIELQDVAGVGARLRTEFDEAVARRVGRDAWLDLSLTLRTYPEPYSFVDALAELADPFLYPELPVDRRAKPGFLLLKRGMDVAFSGLLLILLSPLFALIAVLVKATSPGPALFRQVRVGHLMQPFTMYKFRTMYEAADHQVHHDYVSWFITASDQAQSQGEKPAVFKLTTDGRITPLGRVLRRTSLDELPQLWNVLVGDMSLVGPRPPLPYELQQYKPWHRGRVLEAKPGVTGLWQVVGRSRTTFDEMVRLDLRYARTMSLGNDIKIILATPVAMITGKGAC
jgi:lipopolysaccharide/colanic/teichoic acid biosynthesis glycosyltransferase